MCANKRKDDLHSPFTGAKTYTPQLTRTLQSLSILLFVPESNKALFVWGAEKAVSYLWGSSPPGSGENGPDSYSKEEKALSLLQVSSSAGSAEAPLGVCPLHADPPGLPALGVQLKAVKVLGLIPSTIPKYLEHSGSHKTIYFSLVQINYMPSLAED